MNNIGKPARSRLGLIFAVLIGLLSGNLAFADTGTTKLRINVREAADLNTGIVATLQSGATVEILGYDGEFAMVKTESGSVGYLKSKYLEITMAAEPAAEPAAEAPAAAEPAVSEAEPAPAEAVAAEDASAAVKLEKIKVTGSRIKRVDFEGATPVTVIDREMIDKLGYTDVQSVLGSLTTNSGGTFDIGTSFLFARGSASIDLRGFGAGRTLVLMDGRRLPVFPQGLNGTDAFVDLSTIPASLIERVEILLDGASAIYGSEAISGVVNIITRKDINGSFASARYSGTSDGGGSAQRFQFMQGISTATSSIQLVGEFRNQNVLRFTDRDYSDSDFNNGGSGSGFGSSFFGDDGSITPAPNCGQPDGPLSGLGIPTGEGSFCRFDRSKFRQWVPESDKGSLFILGTRKFENFDTSARIGYYRGRQSLQLEPNPVSGGESAAFTDDRLIPNSEFDPVNGPGHVAAGAPNNPTNGTPGETGGFFFRRLVEAGPRGNDLTTESFNGLLGVSGTFGALDWDLGFSHNQVRLTSYTPTIISSALDNELSNNGLDLFQQVSPDLIRRISHLQTERAVSRNTAIDGTLSGPLPFDLAGGPIQFALHSVYEDQEYNDVFDPLSTVGDVLDGGNGGGGERSYTGVGLEVSLPVLDTLELSLAARVDSYDDDSATGSATSPSVKIAYRPIETLLVRASWGESFRAPDLQRLFGASTNGFDDVTDTVRCQEAGGADGTPVDPNDPNDPCLSIQSVPIQVGANPGLAEEKGENLNIGFVWEPMQDFTIGVDWYSIEVEDLVDDLSAQQILRQCANRGAFCDQIRRAPDGTLGTPSAGGDNRALITATAQNLATQEVEGYDLSIGYVWNLGSMGRIDNQLKWSHVDSLKVRSLSDQPLVEQIGFGETVVVPEDRYSLTSDWGYDNYGLTLRVDLIGEYPGAQVAGTESATPDEFVDEFLTVDLQGRVDFGEWGLIRIGVENVFDEEFSEDPTFRVGTPGVQNQYIVGNPTFFSNPFGRSGYLQYELNF